LELLIANITKHVDLTETEQQIILDSLIRKSFKSKTLLLKDGEICATSYFVVKGILRSFNTDENCTEHTMNFASPGWWIADMYSFISGNPGKLNIETIQDSEVLLLTRQQQHELFDKVPKIERYFRILIENSLVANQQRVMDNLGLSAEERYERFSQKYPTVKFDVPQKHIASYLGITPEFFSKMKKKLLNK